MKIKYLLALSPLVMGARPAAAQVVNYVAVGLARVPVSGFVKQGAIAPSLTLGRGLGALQSVEVKGGYVRSSQPEPVYTIWGGDPVPTVGVSGLSIQGSYRLEVPTGARRFHPYVTIGGDWLGLADSYQADTVRTSLWGGHAGFELRGNVARGLWLSVSSEYRGYLKNAGRPFRSLNLGGWAIGGALGIDL